MFQEVFSSVLDPIQCVMDTKSHTNSPITTGTTVLGLKYADGVMMASDTLASYGSLARYKDVRRLQKIGSCTIIGGSGEISDFQNILEDLNSMNQNDINQDDGYTRYFILCTFFVIIFTFITTIRTPSEFFNYLRVVTYQRRNKGNPLWNQLLIGGYNCGSPFLGYVDLIGK